MDNNTNQTNEEETRRAEEEIMLDFTKTQGSVVRSPQRPRACSVGNGAKNKRKATESPEQQTATGWTGWPVRGTDGQTSRVVAEKHWDELFAFFAQPKNNNVAKTIKELTGKLYSLSKQDWKREREAITEMNRRYGELEAQSAEMTRKLAAMEEDLWMTKEMLRASAVGKAAKDSMSAGPSVSKEAGTQTADPPGAAEDTEAPRPGGTAGSTEMAEVKASIRGIETRLEALISAQKPRADQMPPWMGMGQQPSTEEASHDQGREGTGTPWSKVLGRGKGNQPANTARTGPLPGTSQPPKPREEKKIRTRPTRVMVETAGASYKEVVGRLKRGIREGSNPDPVASAKRSLAGNLVLEAKSGVSGEELVRQINGIVGEGKAKITRGGRMTAEVKFLDEDATKEEVIEALEKSLGTRGLLEVVWIREYGRELRIALVEGPRDAIRRLVERKNVRVGWARCRVQTRMVKPEPCRRCRVFGHVAAECKGEDRSKGCRRCGAEGHVERGCEAQPRCAACEEAGVIAEHFTGSAGCAMFKEALERAKQGREAQDEQRPGASSA